MCLKATRIMEPLLFNGNITAMKISYGISVIHKISLLHHQSLMVDSLRKYVTQLIYELYMNIYGLYLYFDIHLHL